MSRARKACTICGGPKPPGARRKICDECRAKVPTHKVCTKCGLRKTADNFYKSRGQDPYVLSSRCIPCHKAGAKNSTIKRLYGIDMDEYAAIKAVQGGKCAICRRATGATRALAIDHDHKVEEKHGNRASVRGLLCSKCNDLLGHIRDDPETLERAAAYLRNPPAREVLDP